MVLKTYPLGEADRIIVMLTRVHGKIRAVAKGVRRTSSRIGGRLEPFSHVTVQCAEGRSLDIVTQTETLHPYDAPLRHDFQRFAAGQVMLEMADTVVDVDREPALQQYRLLVGALRTLGAGTPHGMRPALMIVDAYLIRALAIAGYAICLDGCARCTAPGYHRWFSADAGGMVCSACRPPRSQMPSEDAWALMRALLIGDWESTGAAGSTVINEVNALVSGYVTWHMQTNLHSLAFVEAER